MDLIQKILNEQNDIDGIKALIENGADVHAENDYALCWASGNGHLRIVELLLENGADVHAFNDSALRYASRYGYLQIVELLIENGADVHAVDDYALRLASYSGHVQIVELLLKNCANVHARDGYALRHAVHYGHLQVVELLKRYSNMEDVTIKVDKDIKDRIKEVGVISLNKILRQALMVDAVEIEEKVRYIDM